MLSWSSVKKRNVLLWGLVGVGLALRIILIPYQGMGDINQWSQWANRTRAFGLGKAYEGNYFPIQYQLFSLIPGVIDSFGHSFSFWIKTLNLFFDVGILALLLRAAQRTRSELWVLGLYWLNPWFLALFVHGFCDFQFGFFIVLFLCLFREDGSISRSFLAGIPLALAFLMKPQAMGVLIMMAMLGVLLLARRSNLLAALAAAVLPSA